VKLVQKPEALKKLQHKKTRLRKKRRNEKREQRKDKR
jgi:hypothetical protein